MNCNLCGKSIKKDTLFCEFCGSKVEKEQSTVNNNSNLTKKSIIPLRLAILVLFLLIMVVIGISILIR